jgi:hypothetical protein
MMQARVSRVADGAKVEQATPWSAKRFERCDDHYPR